MSNIAFPANPALNQQYTFGVKSWQWNGVAWDLLSISNAQVQEVEAALASMWVPDYASLRQVTSTANAVYVSGYLATSAPSGISGTFVRDDHDTTSQDNGGTVIVAANGKRWKRVIEGDLYVTWFGADSSASGTANASAVQAALNSLTGGGCVVFPNGDWQLDTVYVQNDRLCIRGEGDSTIYVTGNMDGIVVGMTSTALTFCEVTNLKFDRVVKSTSGAAVKMVNTVYSKVQNCKFKNSYVGVDVVTHNDSLRVEGCHFYDGTYYGVHEYNQGVTWANDLTIRGNFFWHVENSGVYLGADGVGVASVGDTYILDNVFVSSSSKGALQTQWAVYIVGAGTYNTNIEVCNNTFEGIAKQTAYMTGLNRCRIHGNYFSGTGTNDVGLYFGGGTGNSTIHDNIFVGYNNPAMYIYSTGGCSIKGNHLTSNCTSGGSNADLTMVNVNDMVIDSNYIYSSSSKYAIAATQNGATVDFLTYTNNRFSKYSSNSNYLYDIYHNNYGGNRVIRNNLGNDATSGRDSAPPVAAMGLQWYAGEKVENNTAAEAGTAGSKYVVEGWVCVAQGTPGTWVQRRSLTGN